MVPRTHPKSLREHKVVKCPCHVKDHLHQSCTRFPSLHWPPLLLSLVMNVNFAERAHNHNWKLDPIVRSLLDTDFYKLLMLQFIWKHFPSTTASFSLLNRNSSLRLADFISLGELRAQLEHVRSLRFHKSEIIWLAGNTFYGKRGIFEPAFLDWLEHGFELSGYELSIREGQFSLDFEGPWTHTTLWEIYSLSILSELKTRHALKSLSELELDI